MKPRVQSRHAWKKGLGSGVYYIYAMRTLDLHGNDTGNSSGSYSVGLRTLRGTRLYLRAWRGRGQREV